MCNIINQYIELIKERIQIRNLNHKIKNYNIELFSSFKVCVMLQSNLFNQRQTQNGSQNRLPIPESIVRELQKQKQELIRIKEQQQTIFSIDQTLRKKNSEIVRLRTLVQKYEPFYKKYQDLSYDYSQKCAKLSQKDKQIAMLLKQVDELIKQHEIVSGKLIESDRQRSELLKEQREIQKLNNQIEHTFKLYQQQCKKKEMGLLKDLEKAYKQVTQLNKKIDQYEMKVFQNEELKKKLNQKITKQNKAVQQAQKQQSKPINSVDMLEPDHSSRNLDLLRKQNENFRHALHIKQQELTKYKILNHELSIEFDKSVSKICDFEKQLTKYRQENHELQKMLNLFVEKEKYEQMHMRQLERLKKNENSSLDQESQQQKNGRQNQLAFHTNQQSESEDHS